MTMLRYLFSILLDFVRWSQMVPMVLAWAFMLIALVAMTIINFQQTSFTFFEWVAGLWERHDWLPVWSTPAYEQTDGSVHITDEQLRPLILKAWGWLSLILLIIDLLRTSLFGVRQARSLRRGLVITALGCAMVGTGFGLNYLFGNEPYQGGPFGWLVLFIGGPAVVWLISAYSLSVNHLLNGLNRKLLGEHSDSAKVVRH